MAIDAEICGLHPQKRRPFRSVRVVTHGAMANRCGAMHNFFAFPPFEFSVVARITNLFLRLWHCVLLLSMQTFMAGETGSLRSWFMDKGVLGIFSFVTSVTCRLFRIFRSQAAEGRFHVVTTGAALFIGNKVKEVTIKVGRGFPKIGEEVGAEEEFHFFFRHDLSLFQAE